MYWLELFECGKNRTWHDHKLLKPKILQLQFKLVHMSLRCSNIWSLSTIRTRHLSSFVTGNSLSPSFWECSFTCSPSLGHQFQIALIHGPNSLYEAVSPSRLAYFDECIFIWNKWKSTVSKYCGFKEVVLNPNDKGSGNRTQGAFLGHKVLNLSCNQAILIIKGQMRTTSRDLWTAWSAGSRFVIFLGTRSEFSNFCYCWTNRVLSMDFRVHVILPV